QHPDRTGLAAANIASAAADSLRRLGTDHIDVYYAHYDDPRVPLEETAGAFEELLDAGKIRYVGLSNYSGARIAEWFAIAQRDGLTPPAVLQPHYNLLYRTQYEANLAPVVARENLAVLPYYSLASGLLTGKYRRHRDVAGTAREAMLTDYDADRAFAVLDALDRIAAAHHAAVSAVALAWLRARPHVVAPIASARVPEQLAALLQSTEITLSADESAELDRISD
ncbi:MAG: aldo/keto reductase, partial [Myxococcota bacterium]